MNIEISTEDKDLNTRLRTATILIVLTLIVLLSSYFSCWGRWLLYLVGFILNLFCAFEFSRFSWQGRKNFLATPIYFILPLLPSIYTLLRVLRHGICLDLPLETPIILVRVILVGVLSLLLGIAVSLREGRKQLDTASIVAGDLFIGIIVIGFGGGSLLAFALTNEAQRILLWLIATASLNDSAAYFIGRTIGGPKLAPIISPKKTWSGAIAGLIAGTLSGTLLFFLLPITVSWEVILLIAFAVSLAGQIFDLAKSFLKRMHGVKDSGKILPGHGGMLDRVDGIYGASLALCVILLWLM